MGFRISAVLYFLHYFSANQSISASPFLPSTPHNKSDGLHSIYKLIPEQKIFLSWRRYHRNGMKARWSVSCLSWTLLSLVFSHNGCQSYTIHLPQLVRNRQRQRPFLTKQYHFAKPPSLLEEEAEVNNDTPREQQRKSPILDDSEERNVNNNQEERGKQQAYARERDTEGEADDTIRHGDNYENDSYDDRYLAMEQESEVTRRKWLQQTGAILLGGSALVGTTMMTSKLQQKMQRQQQAAELFQASEQAFIRLEPYPSRRRRPIRQQIIEASNVTAVNGTSIFNKTQTSRAVPAKSSNVTTALKTKANNATKTRSSLNNTSSGGSKSQKPSIGTASSKTADTNKSSTKTNGTFTPSTKELAPVNFTKVAAENAINITLKDCSNGGCTQINGTSFQKVKIPDQQKQSPFTRFLPPFLRPAAPQTVIKDIPDSELILAATVAGSIIEMGRTTLLYPLSTVKTRIQARQQEQQKSKQSLRRKMERLSSTSSSSMIRPQQQNAMNGNLTISEISAKNSINAISYNVSPLPSNKTSTLNVTNNNNNNNNILSPQSSKDDQPKSKRKKTETSLRRRLRVLQLNIRRHTAEGNLYAGLLPSLLVSVPATGVYYSVRDVTKRALSVSDGLILDDSVITLLGALNADVISLMIRTPADALAARLQAAAASQPSAPKSSASTSHTKPEELTSANASMTDSVIQDSSSSSTTDDAIPETVPDATPVGPEMQANQSDAEEVWFREEAAHYMNKGSDIVANSTHTIDALFASVLPGEFDHEEQFLLLQLQRQEYSMEDLMDGLYKEPKEEIPTRMSKKQLKRIRRNTVRRHRKYGMREGNNRRAIDAHPRYIQDFIDAKVQTGEGKLDSLALLKVSTAIDEWGAKLEKHRIFRSMPPVPGENVTTGQAMSGELESEETLADQDAIEMKAENATKALKDGNVEKPTVARMDDKEERKLVQDLQEKNVYDGGWFLQSLERLPAIIITDLPYLLSRIALNRIIIHGKVNIGQYEVQTIAIAMFCALLSTPFDVVRTRLLVENDYLESTEGVLGDDSIGAAANTTIVTADGNVLLVGSNVTDSDSNAAAKSRSQGGVLETMISIAKEGDGGVRNLYAGWLERTAYYGIGRAWLDPINIITYIGIRDTLLLQWFD